MAFAEMIPQPIMAFIISVVFAALLWLYRAAYPKPIPGVPYHKASAAKLFGDMPEMMRYVSKTEDLISFLEQRCLELNSEIIQVFTLPFRKPWVVICDVQETHDIMYRRSQEFDRSDFVINAFKEVVPNNHFTKKTDNQWRSNRRLMGECMSMNFIKTVGRLQIYSAASDLIDLWREKVRLIQDKPFDANNDVHYCILDAIWAAGFGTDIGVTNSRVQHLASLDKLDSPANEGKSGVSFSMPSIPADFEAIRAVVDSVTIPINMPIFPRLAHHLALNYNPKLSRAVKTKNALIIGRLDEAWERLSQKTSNEDDVKCAMDMIVRREIQRAEREGRAPQHKSPTIQDELLGFLFAGHETSSSTLGWGFKLLTGNPQVQNRLFSELRAAFPLAAKSRSNPTAEEIINTKLHYLDATIEEILRVGRTIPMINRNPKHDARVLGHMIPEGTEIFFLLTGPSYKKAAFPVDNNKRSVTSQQAKSTSWDESDIGEFKPERWLVKSENGKEAFDPKAGYNHAFGGGPRGCFGKNLAYMTMRLVFALVIWNFELKETPPALSTFAVHSAATHSPRQLYLSLASRH